MGGRKGGKGWAAANGATWAVEGEIRVIAWKTKENGEIERQIKRSYGDRRAGEGEGSCQSRDSDTHTPGNHDTGTYM